MPKSFPRAAEYFFAALIAAQAVAFIFQIDSWPFSNMPMFTIIENPNIASAFHVEAIPEVGDHFVISRSHYQLPLYLYKLAGTERQPALDFYLRKLVKDHPQAAAIRKLRVIKISRRLDGVNLQPQVIHELSLL